MVFLLNHLLFLLICAKLNYNWEYIRICKGGAQRWMQRSAKLLPGRTTSFIDQTFHTLNERHNSIYQFVMRYNDYILSVHDYGEGIPMTMIEVHTLTYIEEHPGVTVTELANTGGKQRAPCPRLPAAWRNGD